MQEDVQMKLACNYYPETEALVREGRIGIDYFKFPALGYQLDMLKDAEAFAGFIERVSAVRPMLLHGLYPDMERLIARSGTPGISFHPSAGKTKLNTETVVGIIRFLKESYGHLEFISVENSGDFIEANPQLLSEIVYQSGCSLLLDVSHAWCAARRLGLDFLDYLAKLPLDRVHEIHINGWVEKGGDIMCHVKIHEQGYAILKALLPVCRPKIVTIEYGRDDDRLGCGCPILRPGELNAAAMEEIVEQVERVKEMIA